MRFISIERGMFRASLLLGATAFSSVACNTKDVLGVFDPAVATPGSLTTAAAVPVVYAGAIGDFAAAFNGNGLTDAFVPTVGPFHGRVSLVGYLHHPQRHRSAHAGESGER